MRKSTTGEALYKRVTLKIVLPEGHQPIKRVNRAAPGRIFTESAIEKLLEHAAENIEKEFPLWDFRLVPIGPNAFNFVYAGLREAQPAT